MPTLILITDTYPQGLGEAFVAVEIKRIRTFDRVVVIPIGVAKESKSRPTISIIEEDVHLELKRLSRHEKLLGFSYAIISKSVWAELFNLVKTKRLTISNIKYLISVYSYSRIRSKQVLNKLSEIKIETDGLIVQSYWLHTPALVGISIANYFGCPVVSRCHRCDVYESENMYGYIPFREYLLNRLDKVFCISEDAISYLQSAFPKFGRKYSLSRLGTSDFGCGVWSESEIIRVVSCSYIIPVKRVYLLVKALSEVNNISISWIHYGGGTEEQSTRALATKLLYDKKNIAYSFLGPKNHEEIMSDYKNQEFDFFINVSESEGVPVSIMEALSFGIPVIATNVGGTSEIVHDGVNGYLLPKNFNTSSLVEILVDYSKMSLISKKNLRKQARDYWETEASADVLYEKHETIIRGMINGRDKK